MRVRISPAALFVNVTAKIRCGAIPCFVMRWAIRAVRTRVFPEPAPARTRSAPPGCSTASRCCGLSASVTLFPPSRVGWLSPVKSCQRKFKHKHRSPTLGAGRERDLAAMLLFDDATGQREPDTPAARLVGRARLEELILHLGPDSGPIIAHADPTNGIAA